jgi:hypothetical protein
MAVTKKPQPAATSKQKPQPAATDAGVVNVDETEQQQPVDIPVEGAAPETPIDGANPDSPELDIPSVNAPVAPITLPGKAVSVSMAGKVRLRNVQTNRIITGFIDVNIAQKQVENYPGVVEIINENELGNG